MYLKIDTLAKLNINGPEGTEWDLGGYFGATVVSRVHGRTWLVRFGWGEEAKIASRWFSELP